MVNLLLAAEEFHRNRIALVFRAEAVQYLGHIEDRLAVDFLHDVAWLETGLGRGRSRSDRGDLRQRTVSILALGLDAEDSLLKVLPLLQPRQRCQHVFQRNGES